MNDGRKQRISDSFGAAADRYDEHAGPQRTAAALVADIAQRQSPDGVARILEIGCGTGLLTRDIQARWPGAELVATDISPKMLDRAASAGLVAGTFLAMDGEAPSFEGEWFDLILSSLAFQWFDDLPAAIARLVALLRPGGSLIFSTMGQGSFAQWRTAHAACDLMPGVPAYPSLDALRAMLAAYGDAFAFDETVLLEGQGARALIGHLKGIGAVVPDEGRRPLSPAALRRVMTAYDEAGGRDVYQLLIGRVTRADQA
ncbi:MULTISPECIES: methyltransferase domain-containing protein [Sphingobium]|jgi:malonyl-CoA O-methyltransferase|uniref:SAM-dependent methyltransferase n=1 Tax=Sphingobium yanoikuyae TaxID=13690 RepID=A0A0J9D0V9_SPHYA|nr:MULTISPECIES: methyltransferase domain-containing protein [Sphingobium]ATP18684.1 SAM-dependent methyltransferase [Sphingobium yanoikuyae]KMW30962.1 SAM-dependent methyltransferase [Sphingobium yanoikuyae]TKV43294.1 SAM-dependent methyltransferase [Sphingobium sp. MP9-4]